MADMLMDTSKKYYDKDDFASRGVGNTALGLSIGALGVELLRNGGLGNLLGGITGAQPNPEETAFGLYKGYRDADDAIIAQHNKDSFALYKNQRDGYDALKAQVDAINTRLAVQEATQPWKDKAIYDAIAIEAERRETADCAMVNYMNCTFVPQYIADLTPATTSTQKAVYNPLSCMKGNCGCK